MRQHCIHRLFHNIVPFSALFVLAALLVHPAQSSACGHASHAPGSTGAASETIPDEHPVFISGARQITFEGLRAGEGYFSADGSKLVFQSEREEGNPFFQIYLMDLEMGDVELVSTGKGKTTCAWIHPNGEKVLFASTHDDPEAVKKQKEELQARADGTQKRYSWDYDPYYDLYSRNLKTGDLAKLTDVLGYDAEGSWSPDGKHIVFASNRQAYERTLSEEEKGKLEHDPAYFMEIYIADENGGNPRRLTSVPGYDGGPFFSPDGKRICWRRFSENGATAEIYTMNIDGSDQRQLTHIGAMSWAPYYHPSNKYLIFTTNRHGFDNFELYIIDVDGKHGPVRASYTPGFDGLPVFAPDGRHLCWTATRAAGTKGQLYFGDWDHELALKRLAASPAADAAEQDTKRIEAHPVETSAVATSPEIRVEDVRQYVGQLASEEFEGRLTGERGEQLATQYVAEQFERIGLVPFEGGSYFQQFEFTAGVDLGKDCQLQIKLPDQNPDEKPSVGDDWTPLAFSAEGEFDPAEVVFAGYGISVPEADEDDDYDSFVHLDIEDKWVMVFRFMPEDITPERRQKLARYSSLRFKAMKIRDLGGAGMIVVSGPNSQVKSQLVPLRFDTSLAGSSLPAISVTDDWAERVLAAGDKSLKSLQDKLDSGEPQMGFVIPKAKIGAQIELEKVKRTGRSVIARLDTAADDDAPLLAIGAHVDHLGHGTGGSSLATDDEKGQIHYGADDNASGVAAMLEIAEHLAELQKQGKFKPKRDMLFAAWSGEELGLLGSQHFVDSLVEADSGTNGVNVHDEIAAYLNMDMVGRLNDKAIVHGIGSSSIWNREVERRNVPIGLPLEVKDDSYLPTDTTSFYLAGVPILSVFTGTHEDYHTPRDTPDKLNYEGIVQIARFMELVARSVASSDEAPDYIAQKRSEEVGARVGLRAYLGTIPDYGESPIPGVPLTGVAENGPAARAGVRSGDIIVSLAGRKIENIYDYTYAIDALKIGQEVTIIVSRDGKEVELKITPGSRQ